MKKHPLNPGLAFARHVACCGGPLLIIAVAAGALALKAGVAIVLVVAVISVALTLWARRHATCPGPSAEAERTRRVLGQVPPAQRDHGWRGRD